MNKYTVKKLGKKIMILSCHFGVFGILLDLNRYGQFFAEIFSCFFRPFLMDFFISIVVPPFICHCLHYTIAAHLREAGIYPAQWSKDGVHGFRAAVTGL